MNKLIVGEKLGNGYILDAIFRNQYVLAHSPNPETPEPYVVWDLDKDGDTRNGRYFVRLSKAEKCFAGLCFSTFSQKTVDEKIECYRQNGMYTSELMTGRPLPTGQVIP